MNQQKFIHGDWVIAKTSKQLMQIDEYQTEKISLSQISPENNFIKRQFTGKVWCSWVNSRGAAVTQPFIESELMPISSPDEFQTIFRGSY